MDNDKTIIRPRPGHRGGGPAEDATMVRPRPGSDATVVRPRPGGERAAAGAEPTLIRPRPRPFAGDDEPDGTLIRPRRRPEAGALVLRERAGFGAGTLVNLADGLLSLVVQLRRLQSDIDANQLHRQAVKRLELFQQRAAAAGLAAPAVANASYLLCSLLDETVLNTHWGENSSWSQKSLLRVFHQQTSGGDRVFRLIDEALGAVRKDVDFLELAYLCLGLGFEGKYRIDPRGKLALEQLRGDIYQVLQQSRDRFKKELSPNARPALGGRRRLHSFLPLWVLAGVLALAAFGIYMLFLLDLNKKSDALHAELAALVPPPQAQRPAAQARPEVVQLRQLLSPEIERGILKVEDYGTRVAVVLQTEGMFDSGSAGIEPAFLPILDKVAKALESIPGRVVVSGHTDSAAIRSPRFPSNWHLSLARASEVVKYMATGAALSGRMLPEGRGDSEPVADNATAAGRAKNRRVVIDVHYLGE